MPLIFGGDGKRRIPLTAEEQALARVLYDAIRKSTNAIKVEELARIIQRLDPDSLNRLLNAITVAGNRKQIEDALMTSIDIGGQEAVQQIQSIAPKLALPAFLPKPVRLQTRLLWLTWISQKYLYGQALRLLQSHSHCRLIRQTQTL